MVDDSAQDAQRIVKAFAAVGMSADVVRLSNAEAVSSAILVGSWDVIVCDPALTEVKVERLLWTTRLVMPTVPIIIAAEHYPHHLWHEFGSGMASLYLSKHNLLDLPAIVVALLLRGSELHLEQRPRFRRADLQDLPVLPQVA